jgi:glucose/arabinose dehydrogenase
MAACVAAALLAAAGCGSPARLSVLQGTGTAPALPAPKRSLIPVVSVATAKGWPENTAPTAAPGVVVTAFARDLDHPRWLYVLPNGDLLVAETNGPAGRKGPSGIKGWFMRRYMKKSGAAVPSANRITLLRDTNGDGVADTRSVLLSGLNSPFGMALVGSTLYVANTDALVRFPYTTGDTVIRDSAVLVAPLPAGEINYHWTKNIIPSADGRRMYVAIGSNSNVGERGMEHEEGRAAIWEVDLASGFHRLYASGLRNPVGMAWDPDGGLWAAVNERDELGSDVPPDYMTRVADRGFYGWPYSYFGSNVDPRVTPARPDLVEKAIVPDYALGPHTASLGLAYGGSTALGAAFSDGMFVGQHGSWNRKPRSGYKVIFVPFRNGRPSGAPRDVLTGFVTDGGDAYGRPVGVALDARGALLVADDVGNVIWRVTGAGAGR